MNLLQTSRVATRALLRNKLRAFLTTLGIVIGVAAVIAMVAIGEGAKARVKEAFATMGTNLLVISSGSTGAGTGGARGGFGSQPTLTWDDLKADPAEGAERALRPRRCCAQRSRSPARTRTGPPPCSGTTPDYFDIRNWPVAKGAAMSTEATCETGAKVVAPRPDGGATSCSARAPTRWGSWCASRPSPSTVDRRAGSQRASRPRARTTTTPPFIPHRTFRAADPGSSLAKFVSAGPST